MAEIRSFGFIRHLRAETSSHVLYHRDATLLRQGRGLSFWFFPMSASLAEVPVDDRELTFAFHGRSADFQDVVAQGVLTFRVDDPLLLAGRVDFSIDQKTGLYLRQPLERLALQLTQLAQQHATGYLAETPIRTLLAEGQVRIRERIDLGLRNDGVLAGMGLGVVSVRVSSVKPKPELEKALEAPMREKIQQESDEAAFSRRAMAVEKERAIRENELQNQIELARREEQLIAQKGQNDRRQAQEKGEAERIAATAAAERSEISVQAEARKVRLSGAAQAESIEKVEGAKVAVERERMQVFRDTPTEVLLSLAAKELAGKLTRIDHLNLSPDAFGPLLQTLMSAGARKLEGENAVAPAVK